MPRKPVKKATAKKSSKAEIKSRPAAKASKKRESPGKSSATITEKERAVRAANLIANEDRRKPAGGRKKQKTSTAAETKNLLDAIVDGMKERKAKNITVLNMTKIENRVADYFVIGDAESRTHVNSIADSVEEFVMKHAKEQVYHSEGRQNSEWILLDYINIVAHVFLRETREFYNLEGLWGDAEITSVEG